MVSSSPGVAPRIAFSMWKVIATVSNAWPRVAGRRATAVTLPEKMVPAARANQRLKVEPYAAEAGLRNRAQEWRDRTGYAARPAPESKTKSRADTYNLSHTWGDLKM